MGIAVILFAYKRPHLLKRALKTHSKLKGLDYYAFVDYSEMQSEVATIIQDSGIYDVIHLRSKRLGLNLNITSGITDIFNRGYDAVIVLEDDLKLSKDAFYYLVNNLILFDADKNCGSISLDKYPPYSDKFRCWGWATWKDRWEKHKYIEGKGTQATQFWHYHQKNQLYCRCSDKFRARHFGINGEHHKWYSNFGFRPIKRIVNDLFIRALL